MSPKNQPCHGLKKRVLWLGAGAVCKLNLWLAVWVCAAGPLAAQEMIPTKPANERADLSNPRAAWGPDYTNWVEVSAGGNIVSGSKPEFQRRYDVPASAFGGIESLHVEGAVGTNGLFQVDGRGIFDNHDYDISVGYDRKNLGYVRAGFSEFREWYDRHGGFYPPTDLWLTPFSRSVAVDRGETFFEAGLRMPDVPEVTFRYAHDFRSGGKDSTSWGDIDVSAANPRSIVPSFWTLDEKRDLVQLDLKHTISSTEVTLGGSYQHIEEQNQLDILRQPGTAIQRYVTQDVKAETDLFNAHAATATRISEKVLLTVGGAYTSFDTDLGGSRIYGSGFDAVFDPTFRRQVFDEGYLNLTGTSTMHEYLGTVNLWITPWENVSFIPSLRVAQEDESADSSFTATTLNLPFAAPVASADPTVGFSDRDYLDVAESLEARYNGLTNWLFYARGEWSEENGNPQQTELDLLTGDSDVMNKDAHYFTQKYIAGANWYPLPRLNLAAQYYHKMRSLSFNNRLGPPPTDYPGFIQNQDFETDDANFRLTLRPLNSLSLVTRYDFQLSTIDTTGGTDPSGTFLLHDVQSAETTTHIISETVSWSPLSRLYLQGSFNFVLDSTRTPANNMAGLPDFVLTSDNNYWNAGALVGYALNDKTDLQLQYYYYRANDYQNNAAVSQPYGAGAEENGVTATLIRQLSRSVRWTLKYGFFSNYDQTYGGHLSYNAHQVYSSLQYRF